jgi:hypothetical protein
MDRACGRNADRSEAPGCFPAGRLVGFTITTGIALVILGGVVLIPPYSDMVGAEYERDCQKTRIANMQALTVGNDRLIAAAENEDPVLIKRLAMRQLGLRPGNEEVVTDSRSSTPNGLIHLRLHPLPDRPKGWMIRAAAILKKPRIRRGLIVLVGGAMLVGLLVSSPWETYRPREAPPGTG